MSESLDWYNWIVENRPSFIKSEKISYLDLAYILPPMVYVGRWKDLSDRKYKVPNNILDRYGLDISDGKIKSPQENVSRYFLIKEIPRMDYKSYSPIQCFTYTAAVGKKFVVVIRSFDFFEEMKQKLQKSHNVTVDLSRFLKLVEISNCLYYKDFEEKIIDLYKFLKDLLFSIKPLNQHLFVEFLKIFSASERIRKEILYGGNLQFYLQISKEQRYNLCEIWKDINDEHCLLAEALAYLKVEEFMDLIICAKSNKITFLMFEKVYKSFTYSYRKLIDRSIEDDWIWDISLHPYLDLQGAELRRGWLMLQTLFLHHLSFFFLHKSPRVLILLWKNVPDAFLSEGEFLDLVDGKTEAAQDFIFSCLLWYRITIQCDLSLSEKSEYLEFIIPRSLKHQARCVVRSKLRENFKTMSDVNLESMISGDLQNYLTIEKIHQEGTYIALNEFRPITMTDIIQLWLEESNE